MQKPEVSILIPVYNRENFIVDAIESACRQTLGNIEIIVVDNCSTDRTHDVARRLAEGDSRIKVYQNAANVGPVLNWQRCISLATADIAKILWSDDWMDPDYLEKTVPMLLENNDVGFVYTSVMNHSGDSTRILYDQLPKTGIYNFSIFIEDHLFWGERFPVSPGCALFRTRDLKKNLLIDIPNKLGLDYKKYGQGNDLLLFLLCFENYSRFAFHKEPLSHFREHPGCLSASENLSIYILDCMRYFVETGKARVYRDRYYSFLYIWAHSRKGKGKLHSMVLNDADYSKDWGFMVNWRLKKTAKRLLKQSIKYWNKAVST
jgi:glycosyltransferase involved in cell wall biosynthesis